MCILCRHGKLEGVFNLPDFMVNKNTGKYLGRSNPVYFAFGGDQSTPFKRAHNAQVEGCYVYDAGSTVERL